MASQLINGIPELTTVCAINVEYAPYIVANLAFSFFIYLGYIIIRWKFRDRQEQLLYYLFLLAALQFGLNVLLFITHFAPDHGVVGNIKTPY